MIFALRLTIFLFHRFMYEVIDLSRGENGCAKQNRPASDIIQDDKASCLYRYEACNEAQDDRSRYWVLTSRNRHETPFEGLCEQRGEHTRCQHDSGDV